MEFMNRESDLTVFTKMLESAGVPFEYEDSFIPVRVRLVTDNPYAIYFIFDEDSGKLTRVET